MTEPETQIGQMVRQWDVPSHLLEGSRRALASRNRIYPEVGWNHLDELEGQAPQEYVEVRFKLTPWEMSDEAAKCPQAVEFI